MDWPQDLVERAHRLSAPRYDGRSRPMIAKFLRWGDAMRVLGNREARENMKREGIHLSQDYTKRQQNQLKDLRAAGKQGYFLRGKLYIKGEGNRQDQNNGIRQGTPGHRGGKSGEKEGGKGGEKGERRERWSANIVGGVEGSACRGGWGGGWESERESGTGMGEADRDRGSVEINRSGRNEETVRQGWKERRKKSAPNSELTNTQWTYMMSQHECTFSLQDGTSMRGVCEEGRGGGRGWERRSEGKGGQRWIRESEGGEGERRTEWEEQEMEGNENENRSTGQSGRGRGEWESDPHVGVNVSMNKWNEGKSERGKENARKKENEVNKEESEISDVSSVCSTYSEAEIQRLHEDGLIVGEKKKRDRDCAEDNEWSRRQNEKERHGEEERVLEEVSESERGGEEGEKKREEGEEESVVEDYWTVTPEDTIITETRIHADNTTTTLNTRMDTLSPANNRGTDRSITQADMNHGQTRALTASYRPRDCTNDEVHGAAGTTQIDELSNSQVSLTLTEYREREKDSNSTNAGGIRGRATLAKKEAGEKGKRRLAGQQGRNTNKVTSTQASKQTKSSGLVQQTLRNTADRLSLGRGEEESIRGGKGGREIDIDKEITVRCGLRSQSHSNPDK